MKILSFSSSKRPLLTFAADTLESQPETNAEGQITLSLTAEGSVTFQDGIAVEEMLVGGFPCHVTVSEGEDTLLSQPCHLTLFILEPDYLAARVALGD